MRETLAIASILILILPTFFIPDTSMLDSRIVDAALAESSAWMESEVVLPRYLSFIRCLIDRWLVNNYGKDVDEVRLPKTMSAEEWRMYVENEAKSRGIMLYSNVTPIKLTRALSSDKLQNKVFAGRCKYGAIGVRGSLFALIISKRGFAEAKVQRNYSILVCHPCLYFLIKEAHEEIEKGLDDLFPSEVMFVGVRRDYAGAISLLKLKLSHFDNEINNFLISMKNEYSSKGIEIEFDIKREISISKSGNAVKLYAAYEFHIEAWDKEVLYWAGGLRKGWYLKNDLEFQIKMLCRIQEITKKSLASKEGGSEISIAGKAWALTRNTEMRTSPLITEPKVDRDWFLGSDTLSAILWRILRNLLLEVNKGIQLINRIFEVLLPIFSLLWLIFWVLDLEDLRGLQKYLRWWALFCLLMVGISHGLSVLINTKINELQASN